MPLNPNIYFIVFIMYVFTIVRQNHRLDAERKKRLFAGPYLLDDVLKDGINGWKVPFCPLW